MEVGDTYEDAGAAATDNVDGSVTVTTSGGVDTSSPGVYVLTYTAKDAAGNSALPKTRWCWLSFRRILFLVYYTQR